MPTSPDQNVPSSPDIDSTTFPSPSSMLPVAPNTPLPQPTAPSTATPAATPATPQVSAPAPSATQLHTSLFHNILGTLAGGGNRPVMGPNGQPMTDANGNVVMAPASKKALGASILAGALSGMMAGYAAPSKFNEVAPGRMQQDFSGSAAAGAQAGSQFTQAAAQQRAQGQVDQNKLRQFSTADHNLKFHAMSIANDKADRENQQDVVDTWNSTRDAMDAEASNGKVQDAQGNDIDLYSYQNISGTKAMELVNNGSLQLPKDQLIPTQVVDVPNADGNGTHAETLFSVYNPNAMVAITDKLREDNPSLKNVATGTPIPVRVLAQSALNKSNEVLATSGIDNWAKEYNKANPDSPINKDFDLKKAVTKDPIIQRLYPLINKYRQDSISAFFTDLKKDPAVAKDQTMQAAAAKLQDAMGISPKGLESVVASNDATIAAAKKGVDAQPAPLAQVKSFRSDIGTAYPNLTDGQKDLLTKSLGESPSIGDYQKIQNEAERYSDSNTRILMQKAKTDPADPTLVDSIGRGRMVPDRLAYILAKNPQVLSAVMDKYPDFDSSKAASYAQTYKDYTSGKSSIALQAGATALLHLKELRELNTPMAMIPGTSAYTRYENKVDTLAAELAKFYKGAAPTDQDIKGIKATLMSALEYNRTAAILTQAHSMGDKLDQMETTWRNAAPSASYEAPMPGISDEAKQARKDLDPTYTFEPNRTPAPSSTASRPAPPAGFVPVQSQPTQ